MLLVKNRVFMNSWYFFKITESFIYLRGNFGGCFQQKHEQATNDHVKEIILLVAVQL